MKLYTVGYEGCDIEDFCKELKRKGIRRVADIRKNPISRKKGFSKNRLAENLKEYGIEYIPMSGIGVPTNWRKLAKAKMLSREKMFKDYSKKILPKKKEEINVLREQLKKRGLALLCYEADAMDCHRKFVSQKLKRLEKDLVVDNLKLKCANQRVFSPSFFKPSPLT